MGKAIGIDLGTTNSAMAVIDEQGRPRILPNSDGDFTTPSAVLIRGNERLVGRLAKRASVARAKDVAKLIKREMCKPDWNFIDSNNEEYSPEELSAIILRKLKQDAETALGEEVTDVVISVPAYFKDLERNRTRSAGEIAGFNVLRIVNEPTAAALAYGLDQTNPSMTALVFDLGGGTFDVTICRLSVSDEIDFDVLASDGNKFLGGCDFDEILFKHFIDKFIEAHGIDPTAGGTDHMVMQRFLSEAEQCKIDLSSDTEVDIALSAVGKSFELTVTREEFEDMIAHYIKESQDITKAVLKAAKKTWDEIDNYLLVGGSTRIPAVREMVAQLSGKNPEAGINPDQVVAMGAAIVAGIMTGEIIRKTDGEALPGIRIKDVTAHSQGIVAVDKQNQKYNSIIIPKNTHIPAEESKTYTTVGDGQTEIVIEILQGEDRNPDGCTKVGDEHVLSGIPARPAGQVNILCTMKYNLDGIIELTASEKESGRELHIETKGLSLKSVQELSEDTEKTASLDIK